MYRAIWLLVVPVCSLVHDLLLVVVVVVVVFFSNFNFNLMH